MTASEEKAVYLRTIGFLMISGETKVLHNLKHVKNTHGGVLLLVKVQAEVQSIIYDLTFIILLLIH